MKKITKNNLRDMLYDIYEEEKTWSQHIAELNYDFSAINNFLAENSINLQLTKEWCGIDNFIQVSTYIVINEKMQGSFTFDSEANEIECQNNEESFIDVLYGYIDTAQQINEHVSKS